MVGIHQAVCNVKRVKPVRLQTCLSCVRCIRPEISPTAHPHRRWGGMPGACPAHDPWWPPSSPPPPALRVPPSAPVQQPPYVLPPQPPAVVFSFSIKMQDMLVRLQTLPDSVPRVNGLSWQAAVPDTVENMQYFKYSTLCNADLI